MGTGGLFPSVSGLQGEEAGCHTNQLKLPHRWANSAHGC